MSVRGRALGNGMGRITPNLRATNFTMMGWFYGYNFTATRGHLLAYHGTGETRRLRVETNSLLNLWGGVSSTNGSEIATGRWFHAAMTYDGTTTRAFLDGVLNISIAGSGGPSGPLYIGNVPDIGDDQYLNGRWAAIKLWNSALNADDIQREMAQYLPVRLRDLHTFSPCMTVDDAIKNFASEGRLLIQSRAEVARHPGDAQARWMLHGVVTVDGTLVGSVLTEDDPPIIWGRAKQFVFPRQVIPPADTTLTVQPAQQRWRATTESHVGTSPPHPTSGRRLVSPRLRLPLQGMSDKNHALNQGLASWYLTQPWMMTGERLYDSHGEAHGTWQQATVSTDNRGWGATTDRVARGELRFNGVSGGVRLRDVEVGGTAFTLAAWIRPLPRAFDDFGGLLVDDNNRGLFYNQQTLNYYEGSSHRATTTLVEGRWQHIAVVSIGTSVRFYINGEAAGSVDYTVGTPTFRWIGTDELDVVFLGMLDDIRVYRRSLGAEDITRLYLLSAAGNQALLSTPKRLWLMGGGDPIPRPQGVTIQPAKMAYQPQLAADFLSTTSSLILTPGRMLGTPRLRVPRQAMVDRNHRLNQGLVAWYLAQPWMFDGRQWYDALGTYDGTLGGMAAGTDSSGWGAPSRQRARGELRFDGSDDSVALTPIVVGSSLFTVALWVYPHEVDPLNYGGLIVDTNNRGLFYNQTTLNYYEFFEDSGSHVATTQVPMETWTWVAMTTSATAVQFYVNGHPAGSVTYAAGAPAAPTFQWLGNDELSTVFRGRLDDIRVYNRALTPPEIQDLYLQSVLGNLGLMPASRRLWAIGSVAQITESQEITVSPAPMAWLAPAAAPMQDPILAPARLQWQVQETILTSPAIIPQATIVLTRGRRLVHGRLRIPAVEGVNEAHPLNQGLVAWWLAQPWMFPGNTWDELVNGYEGRLVSSAAGSIQSGWGSTIRPGGRGELRFDGSNDSVVLQVEPVTENLFTIALWMHPTVARGVDEYAAVMVESNNRGLFYNQSTLNYYEFGSHRATGTITVGAWQHVAVVATEAGVTFYINGYHAGSVDYSVGGVTWQWFGNDENDTTFQGALDDIRLYNRALTPVEIQSLYTTSLTGHLETLQFPRKLWVLGGIPAPIKVPETVVRWQAVSLRFDLVKLAEPTKMAWAASTATVARVIPPVHTVLASLRRIVQPRVRFAPRADLRPLQAQRLGLLYWYLAQPWQFPGTQWLDLVGEKLGAFVNMPVHDTLAGWHPSTHPGGRGAMGFDGTARAIQIEPDATNSNLTRCTLSAWVYPRTFGTTSKVRILDKMGIAGMAGWYLGLSTTETTSRAVEFAVGGSTLLIAFSPNNVIDLHTWTHITVVWGGSMKRADVQIYLNGIEVGTQTGSVGQEGALPTTTDTFNPLYLGNRDVLDRGFDGLLDDLRVYTRPLAKSEVLDLYQDSLTGAFQLLQRPRFPLIMGGQVFTEPPIVAVPTPAQMAWQAVEGALTRTITVQPSQVAWQAQGPIFEIVRRVEPAQLQWQAQTLVVGRSAAVAQAQMVWQAQTLLVGRVSLVTPAQMPWQAGTGAVTRTGVVTPPRMQWQAQAVLSTSQTTLTPAQVQWQAQTLALTRSVVGQGVQVAWVAQALAVGRILTGSPARLQWQTSLVGIEGILALPAARLQWQGQALVMTRVVNGEPSRVRWQTIAQAQEGTGRAEPVRMVWQTQAPQITRTLLATPARLQWQAQTPPITSRVDQAPARLQWQAQTLALGRVNVVTPAWMRWQASVLQTHVVLLPASVQWQAQGLVMTRVVMVVPARLQWQASTAALTRSAAVVPARLQWQAQTLTLSRVLVGEPAQLQWQVHALSITRVGAVQSARQQWQVLSLLQTRTGMVQGAQHIWQAQTLVLGRGCTVVPTRLQWQAQTLLLGRGGITSPAQMPWQVFTQSPVPHLRVVQAQQVWQAQVGPLGRGFMSTPTRLQWQTFAVSQTGQASLAPARVVWQAQTLVFTRVALATPARIQWAAQTGLGIASLTVGGGQQAWQAQDRLLTRGLLGSPAQQPWQAQTLAQTRTVVVQPAQLQWQTPLLLLGRVLTAAQAQQPWQAQALFLGRVLTGSPSRLQWQGGTLALGRVAIAAPGQVQWQVQTLFLGRIITTQASQSPWQAQSLFLGRVLTASPARVQWQAQRLFLGRVASATPARIVWQTQTLMLGRVVIEVPARLQWQPQDRTLTRGLVLERVQAQWQAEAVRITRVIPIASSQMVWVAFDQSMVPNLVLRPGQVQWFTDIQRIPRILLPSISHMRWQAGTGRAQGPDTLLLGTARMVWRASVGDNRRGNPPAYAVIAPGVLLVLQCDHGEVGMAVEQQGPEVGMAIEQQGPEVAVGLTP